MGSNRIGTWNPPQMANVNGQGRAAEKVLEKENQTKQQPVA